MFPSHHSRPAIAAFVTVLSLALCAPGAVTAQDEVTADEQVLVVQDQDPALAPAVPSWDETSGYGAVEASRATIGHDDVVRGFGGTGHEASAARSRSWDELSGYGSVEASRAAVSAMLSGEGISGREQALAFAAAATFWDATSGYGSVEANRAVASTVLAPVAAPSTCADSALASGQSAESARLATVSLPGEAIVDGALAAC